METELRIKPVEGKLRESDQIVLLKVETYNELSEEDLTRYLTRYISKKCGKQFVKSLKGRLIILLDSIYVRAKDYEDEIS